MSGEDERHEKGKIVFGVDLRLDYYEDDDRDDADGPGSLIETE